MSADAKQKLVEMLIHKAFDPVLHKSASGLSETEKRKLEHVQRATKSEIERYRGYGSAKEVVTNFRRDLDSDAAQKVHRELESLHLPTINDIRDEFGAKVDELGVKG
jgi:hypothetical protein